MGLHEVIAKPTVVYCDNNTAIHWVKTGKITDGNQYLALAYHQPREWEREGEICVLSLDTKDNLSDLGSKPCGPKEHEVLLNAFCGHEAWVIRFPRPTISMT